ncbi:MAG: class D beta-lactamase [Maribacter sp.]
MEKAHRKYRYWSLLLLLVCFSCKEKNTPQVKTDVELLHHKIQKPEFQSILDSADVSGAILIYDFKADMYYSNDFKWANTGQLPASTFKIANSIIGLETGVIESDSTIFKWDGESKPIKSWEQDLVLKDAFQFSCVPCYQKVARNIGAERMNNNIKKLNYGSLKIDSTNIDSFWLRGESRITQIQQIDFLKRFYERKLPISERTQKIMKTILLVNETDQYKLSGKSGLSNENENYNGWYVGYIEVKDNTYLFATNIVPNKDFDFNSFVPTRKKVTQDAFKALNLLN